MKLTLILLCSALLAQESQTGAPDINPATQSFHGEASKTVTPPAIPAEASARFWQAQAQLISAQAAVDAIKAELAVICGADYFWDVGKADKPVCVAKPKPEAPKPEAPKAAPAKPATAK